MISASDVEWAKNFGAQRGRRYGIGEDEGASIALVALWEAALAWSPAKGKAEMRSLAYSKISWAILDERRRVFGDWRRSSQVATWVTLDEAENESVQPSQEHRAELHLVAKASVGLGRRKEWLLKEAAFERILPAGRKSSDCRARQAARKELKERLAA